LFLKGFRKLAYLNSRSTLQPFFIALIWITLCPCAVLAASFEYLYIEASEGNSSGGHSAIEFNDEIYHFQHHDSGLIRLLRQDKQEFHFQYRFLQNRRIHSSHIDVSDETFTRLRDYFKLQFLAQSQQFNLVNQLDKDHFLLQHLLYKARHDETFSGSNSSTDLQLKGVGLFYNEQQLGNQAQKQSSQSSPLIEMLRQKIEQRYCHDYLNSLSQHITNRIKALTPTHWPIDTPLLSTNHFPVAINSFTDTYTNYLTGLVAIKVLMNEQTLRPDAYFVSPELITTKERLALVKLKNQLTLSLVKSVNSKRPDWGYATLINLARIIVLDHSLQLGRWVFLDDFARDSEWISVDQYDHYTNQMLTQINDAKTNLTQTRNALLNLDDLTEVSYSNVEMAANRYFELLKVNEHKNIRYIGEKALPTKSTPLPDWVIPELSQQQLISALSELDTYQNKLIAELSNHYSYDLITRNCVTELFRTIDQAMLQQAKTQGNQDELLIKESENRLGGTISAEYNFIPFISFQSVQENYKVTTNELLGSYRDQQLAKLYTKNNEFIVNLREANTFTSSIYNYNPDDAFFIFFTDGNLALRPVFGLFNTAAGLGQSLLGFLSWPFDAGKNLKSGATGVLMSLPELLFFNMRKGSYKYLSYQQFLYHKE
jgi:hypothetical protein